MKVKDEMTKDIVAVDFNATAKDAAKKMDSENVGSVLILDNGLLKGLVTDRQIVTKVIAADKNPSSIKVNEFMTKNPVTISPEAEIHDACRIVGEHGYRRIPVVEGGKPIGIISAADLVEHAKACDLCTQNIFKELQKAER